MNQKLMMLFPKVETDERIFIENAVEGLNEKQLQTFAAIYNSKRKDAQTILLMSLAGFLGVAGIQRFILGQIPMGIIYLLTLGFCGIGTILDLVNHKKMAREANQNLINETMNMVKSS